MTLADARKVAIRSFIKPADEKCFEARVYSSGDELPPPGPLLENLAVLVQEVVNWRVEVRCFVKDRRRRISDGQGPGLWPYPDTEAPISIRHRRRRVIQEKGNTLPKIAQIRLQSLTWPWLLTG